MEEKNLNPEVPPENTNETPEATPGGAPKEGEQPQVPDNPKFEDIDNISDVEALRKIAKDQYATRIRLGKKLEKSPDSKPTESADFLTKKDFHKTNEKEAIEQVTTVSDADSEEMKQIKKDLNEHWDSIKSYFPRDTSRDRVKDVVEGIYDAHARWKRRGGAKAPDTSTEAAAELARNTGKPGGKPTAPTGAKKPSTIPKPVQMSEWYPKK